MTINHNTKNIFNNIYETTNTFNDKKFLKFLKNKHINLYNYHFFYNNNYTFSTFLLKCCGIFIFVNQMDPNYFYNTELHQFYCNYDKNYQENKRRVICKLNFIMI